MTNIMLEVKNLKKIYDELGPSPKIALDDLSFEIKNNCLYYGAFWFWKNDLSKYFINN